MLDQDKPTSRLIKQDDSGTTAHDEDAANYPEIPSGDKPSTLKGHDNVEVRALSSSASDLGDEKRSSATPVLWNGLPLYILSWDLASVVLAICFLVLGACVASLQGRPKDAWSEKVIQATRIAPSIWPIVFSGVLGSAVRALADWRVERGLSLMALEQLLGSLTMAGTVITIFRWSIFRVSSAALILLWAFNPLGSQASFRGAFLRPEIGTTLGSITYNNADLVTQVALSSYGGTWKDPRATPAIRALYSSALYDYVSTTQHVDPTSEATQSMYTVLGGEGTTAVQAAMDIWSNVRIPNLEYHSNYSSVDPHRWLETPWNQRVMNYSSLVGDRMDGVSRSLTGNTTFVSSSSYQSYKCAPWFTLNTSNKTTTNQSDADAWLVKYTNLSYINHTQPQNTSRSSIARTFFISRILSNMTSKRNTSELIFASKSKKYPQLYLTNCTARTTYVDVNVTCISRSSLSKLNCGVGAIREMPKPPRNPDISVLDQNRYITNSFEDFMDILDDVQASTESSVTEYYLANPLTAFTDPELRKGDIELGSLDIKLFERRFSLLWNTLWKIGWSKKNIRGGSFSGPFQFAGAKTGSFASVDGRVESTMRTTSKVVFPLPPVYAIDPVWMTVYFVATGVMLFAAVFALVVRSKCHAPIVLGYVSSLIRDSTYFQDRSVYYNSAEDGPSKTGRLRNLQVMVADVGSGKETGRIAFAPAAMGKRVQKKRWYD
ncbi:hypothetical protein CC86DRAFT_388070 [Ophiobolus disseminans]|uniref:Uncharacterized protein n=1 Tax=Ophiobolus disseminans TaxID=1469910 RepID=A0A6A6ZGD6_9PLEO|nr:hypothetical protein CC86DRAFT_388070 [Ophiobolus disseminans]